MAEYLFACQKCFEQCTDSFWRCYCGKYKNLCTKCWMNLEPEHTNCCEKSTSVIPHQESKENEIFDVFPAMDFHRDG